MQNPLLQFQAITLILAFTICSTSFLSAQSWVTDLDTAQQIALEQGKKIVLVFSGSDWCAPCMKLDQEILGTEEFRAYADNHYVMLKADFPRKKKNQLSSQQQKKNGLLAEQYNRQGFFPYVVILDHERKALGATGYKSVSPSHYIATLNAFE